ncbi:MAG: hypothetical protein ACOC7P_01775 [Chloroflexota bacterium]
MDIAIVSTLVCLAFGAGIWFHRITNRLKDLDKKIAPLILLHKEELIKYYLDKGITPNPSLTPRKQHLIDALEAGTISYSESQELATLLREDERRAREAGNTEALIAILGLLALVIIFASLVKQ